MWKNIIKKSCYKVILFFELTNVFFRSKAMTHGSEVSVGRNLKVSGTKGQRKLIVCVSEFLEYMHLMEGVRDIPKKAYLYKVCIVKVLLNSF